MPFLMKYTAKRDTWGGAVKAGESFTVEQYSSGPQHAEVKNHLEKMGRKVSNWSSAGSGGLDPGEVREVNEWIIERIK